MQRIGDGEDTFVRVPINMSDDAGFNVPNANLRRDRLLQAAIMVHFIEKHAAGVSRCFVNHAVMAFHRTAVELTMPFIDIQDSENWWYSAAIQNYYAGAVYPTYCVEYQDVGFDGRLQFHGDYPRGNPKTMWISPLRLVGACLANAGFPGFHASMAPHHIEQKVMAPVGRTLQNTFPGEHRLLRHREKAMFASLPSLHCLEWGPQPEMNLASS